MVGHDHERQQGDVVALVFPPDYEALVDNLFFAAVDLHNNWSDIQQGPAAAALFGDKLGQFASAVSGGTVGAAGLGSYLATIVKLNIDAAAQ